MRRSPSGPLKTASAGGALSSAASQSLHDSEDPTALSGHGGARTRLWPAPAWLPLAAALLLLYVPTFYDMLTGLWSTEEQAHGPIILAIALWLLYRNWGRMLLASEGIAHNPAGASASASASTRGASATTDRATTAPVSTIPESTGSGSTAPGSAAPGSTAPGSAAPESTATRSRGHWLGWPALVLSLCAYFLGRAQSIALFEVGSLIGTLIALMLLTRGPRALAVQWFPLFFMLFMLPLPGSLVDLLTMPMKTAVSWVVDRFLYGVGYPISRTGVILQIGQYQLLVADACAGLHTLFTLEALGLLYLNIVRHTSLFRNIALAILIVPISFLSNVIRVMVLTLVTYHFGDAAGQGFLHGFAGMVLFVSALLLIIGADSLLRVKSGARAMPLFHNDSGTAPPAALASYGKPRAAWLAAILMGLALLAAIALQPTKLLADTEPTIVLETRVPAAFGDWRIDPDMVAMVPSSVQQDKIKEIYSQTLSRTYINSQGQRIMLAIAYGSKQTRQMRAHRQEVCYTAQGFQVSALHAVNLPLGGVSLPATRMVAVHGERTEPVTYWFTMGDSVVRSYLDRQLVQLKYALSDFIPDGYLFRVSSISTDSQAAFAAHAEFSNALIASLDPPLRAKLLGTAP